MATSNDSNSFGHLVAAADLSTKQYYAVKVDSNGKIALCSSAGEFVTGILQNKPVAAEAAQVQHSGTTKAVAGAAITAGARVMTNASGKVITLATSASIACGVALESAGADGDIIEIALIRSNDVP